VLKDISNLRFITTLFIAVCLLLVGYYYITACWLLIADWKNKQQKAINNWNKSGNWAII